MIQRLWRQGVFLMLMLGWNGCSTGSLPGQGADEFKIVVYRDTWGVPHLYAPTVQAGCYAMGWTQAQDRPQELLKNLLRGMGEVAAVEGESSLQSDLIAHLWDHYETARRQVDLLDEDARTYLRAFVRGINDYYASHPEDLPEWWGERKVDEFMVIAFGRQFLFSWSVNQGFGDLKRGGIEPGFDSEERGSNQWAVSPDRSAEGAAILIIDPHLSWWGASRFWEFRIHAGRLKGSGFTLPGFPAIGLGHNEHLAWAMTTGGPDTADIYELSLNPRNSAQYRYDSEWRDLTPREFSIRVKGESTPRTISTWDSHYGPVVAMEDGKAYAMKMAYAESVNTLQAWFELAYGDSYQSAVEAMRTLEIFPQNVMVADTSGNIYYQRTGRVPERPEGRDWSRPVDGSTADSEWQGFRAAEDLVQILNPEQGYMQNCNVPPDVMMVDSSLTADKFPPDVYSDLGYGSRGGWSNSRGARAVELLAEDESVTLEEAIDYVLDVKAYGAERWIRFLEQGVKRYPSLLDEDLRPFLDEMLGWDGRLTRDSAAALKYYYWRTQMAGQDFGSRYPDLEKSLNDYMAPVGAGDTLPEFGDEQLETAVRSFESALEEMERLHGIRDLAYGDVFRVGRGDRSWPVGGGGSDSLGLTTLRNVGFGDLNPQGMHLGRRGQSATQVVVLSEPIRSWSAAPIGQSDRPDSPHYRDQAEQLFSRRQLKPTWWRPEELVGNIRSRTVLEETN